MCARSVDVSETVPVYVIRTFSKQVWICEKHSFQIVENWNFSLGRIPMFQRLRKLSLSESWNRFRRYWHSLPMKSSMLRRQSKAFQITPSLIFYKRCFEICKDVRCKGRVPEKMFHWGQNLKYRSQNDSCFFSPRLALWAGSVYEECFDVPNHAEGNAAKKWISKLIHRSQACYSYLLVLVAAFKWTTFLYTIIGIETVMFIYRIPYHPQTRACQNLANMESIGKAIELCIAHIAYTIIDGNLRSSIVKLHQLYFFIRQSTISSFRTP